MKSHISSPTGRRYLAAAALAPLALVLRRTPAPA